MHTPISRRRLFQVTGATTALSLYDPVSTSAVTGTATVIANLNLRSGPAASFGVLAVMPSGSMVTVLSGPSDGWYQVTYQSNSGWASGQYLAVSPNTDQGDSSGTGTATVNQRLNLRSGPGTTNPVLLVMPVGATVSVLADPSGGWYQITYLGTTGWASGQYLTITYTAPPEQPGGTGTATVNQGLNLREGPGTSYAVLAVMESGASVTVVSNPGGGWVQITYQGITGWASSQYLTLAGIAARTATIGTDTLNLRAAGNTSSSILGQMLYGETVEIASSNGDWYQVTYHGKDGYAYGPYLDFGGPSGSMWVPVHQQKHSLSCEYASCQIATAGLGREIDEDKFIPVVGKNPNPHLGYRGNIDGTFIYGYEDYGVYPRPLVKALPKFGFIGRELTGGKTELISELAAHHPVVVWIDLGYTSSFMFNIGGEMVLMATKSHVVCAYGYNDEGVLISDPDSSRRKRVIPWSNFMRMWNSMDQYSLAITLA